MQEVVNKLVYELKRLYPQQLSERFKLLDLEQTPPALIEEIGRKRGCIVPGNKVDLEKTYKVILKEYREGKIGPISLDWVEEFSAGGGV
jgi:ribosome biogenesis GTPase A